MQSPVKFDYTHQAWLRDSGDGLRYTRCGHPESKNCDCFGKVFEGFTECEAARINGVFCHETGCPNQKKTWRGEWVRFLTCFECGCDVEEGTYCGCCPETGSEN